MFITNQIDYTEFLNKANRSDVIAIDTEFLRDKTYWPKLCLLQLAIKDEFAIVDPFAVDVSPISRLFNNKNLIKLFHSPRQDIEILLYKTKTFPKPIFDTQIAASFLGMNMQIGYANLVQSKIGVKLNKQDTFSDWEHRPLTKSQIDYAKNDVVYLIKLYPIIIDELKKLNRLNWVQEDIDNKYGDKKLYEIIPEERYLHLKRASSLHDWQIACAKEVATWREKTAIKRNIPRKWILSDEKIIEISKRQPKNISELFQMRNMKKSFSTEDARNICLAVDRGMSYKKQNLPTLNVNDKHNFKKDIKSCDVDVMIDVMNSIIKQRAYENNLAAQLISTNSELSKIAHGINSNIDTLSGWRKKIVGDELLDFINGKISVNIKNGKLNISKI